MARRPPAPQPITSVRIETLAPVLRPEPEGAVRRPWHWQEDAIARLQDSDRRMLTAPTGSGKSAVVQALGLHDLARGLKVIVAVPQLSIASGYEREVLEIDGERREWNPGIRVDSARVRRIVRFLLGAAAPDQAARTLVCTHLALAMAATHPDVIAASDPWRDASLFLDEAHHSLAVDDGASRRGPRRVQPNALGQIVTRYLSERASPLTLITATWMRTDDGSIVPAPELETFAHYHRGFDEHMKDMRHVRVLEIRFVVGAATECLEALFKERHPAGLKTVVWHPPPGSALLRQQGGKHGALAMYRKATGWRREHAGPWDCHEFDGKSFTALELIDDGEHRDASVERLLAGIHAQKLAMRERRDVGPELHRTPDVVWALNLLREGSDYPALARGILMAPRGAMIDTLQMLGRLLRDFPNKDRVEFNIVLPIDGPALVPTADQVSRYLKYMMASVLVEWQFRGFGLDGTRLAEEERRQVLLLEQGDVQQQLASDIVDAAVRLVDAGLTPEEEAERIAGDVVERGMRFGDLSANSRGVIKQRLRQMLVGRPVGSDAGIGDFQVEETLVGRLRSFVGRFGYRDLRELREGHGRAAHITIEQVRVSMKKFQLQYGRWPRPDDREQPPDLGGTWKGIEMALRKGGRGLTGRSSLARERDFLLQRRPRKALTRERIIDAVIAYHRDHGEWPKDKTRGEVPGLGYAWSTLIQACSRGRLFPNGYSLRQLVRECQGRPVPRATNPLTLAVVHAAVRAYHDATGAWPNRKSPGTVPLIGIGWLTLDNMLTRRTKGLPECEVAGPPLSLARVVAHLREVLPRHTLLTLGLVQSAMLAWWGTHGWWPKTRTEGVAPGLGMKWRTLNNCLRFGERGLPRGLSLRRVREMIESRASERRAV